MKKVLLLLLLFTAYVAQAQTTPLPRYLSNRNEIGFIQGIARIDSGLAIPGDTIVRAWWPQNLYYIARIANIPYVWDFTATPKHWVPTGIFDISGLITSGSGITIVGSGNSHDPYVIVANADMNIFQNMAALRASTLWQRNYPQAVTLGYYAKDDGGAAVYDWDATSTHADDGGGYINPTGHSGSGRWILKPDNGIINIKQFGAKAEWNNPGDQGFDNRPALLNAIDFTYAFTIANYNFTRYKIRVPASDAYKFYYVSDSVILKNGVEFFGDGASFSSLMFQGGKTGFIVPYPGTVAGTQDTYIHDLLVESYGSSKLNKHGITINARVRIERVVVQSFQGDGFHIEASAPTGNCNNSYFSNCTAYGNNQNGYFIDGSDVNNMTFIEDNASDNQQWGFWESSFLGNSFLGCHTAENGTMPDLGAHTMVYNNGIEYSAIQQNINVQPGVTSGWQTSWQVIGALGAADYFHPQWTSTTTYYGGGSFFLDDPNQAGLLSSCYTEGGEPQAYNVGRYLILNGFSSNTSTGGTIRGTNEGIELSSMSTRPTSSNVQFRAGRTDLLNGDFGIYDQTRGVHLGFGYDTTRKYLSLQQNASFGRTWFSSTITPAAQLGRAISPDIGELGVTTGIYFGVRDASGYKRLSFEQGTPTTQAQQGDISIHAPASGASNLILRRAITTGAPATWQNLYGISSDPSAMTSTLNYNTSLTGFYTTHSLVDKAYVDSLHGTTDLITGITIYGDTGSLNRTAILYHANGTTNTSVFRDSISGGNYIFNQHLLPQVANVWLSTVPAPGFHTVFQIGGNTFNNNFGIISGPSSYKAVFNASTLFNTDSLNIKGASANGTFMNWNGFHADLMYGPVGGLTIGAPGTQNGVDKLQIGGSMSAQAIGINAVANQGYALDVTGKARVIGDLGTTGTFRIGLLTTPLDIVLTAQSTGTIAAGTYYVKEVATDAEGTSLAGAATSIALNGTTQKGIVVSGNIIDNATGYRFYVSTDGTSFPKYFVSSTAGITITALGGGDGSVAGTPPTVNTSGAIFIDNDQMVNKLLPTYDTDTSAGTGGLQAGQFYETSTGLVRIKRNGTPSEPSGGSYTLPAASTSTLGGVKTDGTTTVMSGGNVLSVGAITESQVTSLTTDLGNKVGSTTDNNLTVSGTAVSTKKAPVTLTDAATVTWDVSGGYNAKVTLGGNRTLSITNPQAGQYYKLTVIQDGTGSRTLTLPAGSLYAGGTAITLTTTAAAKDILMFFYDGTNYFVVANKDFK